MKTTKTFLMSTVAATLLAGHAFAYSADKTTDTATAPAGSEVSGNSTMTATMEGESDTLMLETDGNSEASMMADGDMEDATQMPAIGDMDTTMMADAETGFALKGMTVENLIGMNVRGENDEIVGEIDYVIETANSFEAVIGVGGFLGLGEYTVALPIDRFDLDSDDDVLVVSSLTEDELRAMPEIDEGSLDALDGDVVLN